MDRDSPASLKKVDILAQRLASLLPARQLAFGAFLLGVPALGVVTAFGIAPGAVADTFERSPVVAEFPLPEITPRETPAVQRFASQERVLRGDTVASLFQRLGIADDAALEFLRLDPVGRRIFRKIIPGRIMQAETGDSGGLASLRYFVGSETVFEVLRGPKGFVASERAPVASALTFYKSATITSSLFAATDAAGIPDSIAMQIARVFATDIDFHVDIRSGDRFSVIYEMSYENGELVSSGRILAAEFVNQGRTYNAILFRDEDGEDSYFELDGTSRAKAFLRSPVEFSRVSSGFGRRFHPIFKNWRAHTGADFAAPRGTRVLAAADGVVTFAGRRNGYGSTVELRHGGGITTLYAHLSAFAPRIRSGIRVKQGDPIAFVGATGWATGPHLHYEFKISGIHQDPMKVALPKATPVPARLRPRFDIEAAQAGSRIAMIRGTELSDSNSVRSLAIGVMSGTSLDGADAVLVDVSSHVPRCVATSFVPFPTSLKARLLALCNAGTDSLDESGACSVALADIYAESVVRLLETAGVTTSAVQVIGCHGQTVRHRPALGYTLQLNDAARLADRTGIDVVADFRSRDVAAGGQGAPLVPVFHEAVFRHESLHRVVVNIGGMSNITSLRPGIAVSGFDCGPGNVLMDSWTRLHRGHDFDEDGHWASEGKVDPRLLASLMAEPFLAASLPKSTGRELFNVEWLDARVLEHDSPADVQASLLEFTAAAIVDAIDRYCGGCDEIYLCGGGARNRRLAARIRELAAPRPVQPTDDLGVPAGCVEAMAFAWLAVKCIRREAVHLASVTGATHPCILGAIYPA